MILHNDKLVDDNEEEDDETSGKPSIINEEG